ncbi:MAG TPA: DUF3857 domain-containing protein [Caulobacteraceae bacterium]|jgi:Flp pilus assembly protein TadD
MGLVAALAAGGAQAGDKLQIAPAEAWVKPLPVAAAPADAESSKPARVLVGEFQVRFDDKGEHIYQHVALAIQTPAGLAAANVALSWRPDVESMTVNEVRIIRGGQPIDVLASQTFTVIRREANLERAMLDGALTATLQPNGLQVGDTLEFAYTLTRHDVTMGNHDEGIINLLPGIVVDNLQFREVWPSDRPMKWRETEGLAPATVTKGPQDTELVIRETNAERPKPPENAPSRYDYLSILETSDFQRWNDVSALIAPLFDKAATLGATSPLRAEAQKIRAATSDPKAQAAAALKLVQDQIRYLFLGMNLGGYTPAPADLTWSRRFGDCKGKTVVLLALLHELGIEAEPVLVSSTLGDGMNERLPMVELFDHVLVRAHIGGAYYWLDGTRMGDRSLDTISAPDFRWGLPLSDQGSDLLKIDPQPPAAPLADVRIRIDASAGLDALAPTHVETIFRGDIATLIKMQFAAKTGDDLDKALHDFAVGAYPWMEAKDTKTAFDDATGEERLTTDGVVSMTWALNAPFHVREYEVSASQLGADPDFKRKGAHADAPYAVPFPSYLKTTESIVLPQGGKGFGIVGDDIDKTIAGSEYKRSSRIEGGVFTTTVIGRAVATEFPAAEAPAAKAALSEMSDETVRLRAPKDYTAGAQELALRLARTPTLPSEYVDRARARLLKKDYAGAIADYGDALKLNAGDPELLNDRCFTRGMANVDLPLAVADCNAALDQKPHDASFLDSRGFVYFRMGSLDKAASDLNQALNIAPDQAPTLYVRGLIERRQGDKTHADADIAAAKTVDPTVAATYAGYGVAR